MGKDKSPGLGGGLPPPFGPFSGYSTTATPFNVKSESPSSSASYPPLPVPAATSDSASFSHDISRMPDNPPRNRGHRRAHSEILTLLDDISFDNDLGIAGGGADAPSLSDDTEEDLLSMYLDMDKFNSSSATSRFEIGEASAAAAAAAALASVLASGASTSSAGNIVVGTNERPRVRHQHSQSMDDSTSIKPEILVSGSDDISAADSKKAVSAAKLAELALIDPKRAKRIWANRQSAARSKERKTRYISELERRLQTLQTEATSLSAQLSILQGDASALGNENKDLKLRVQSLEQQVHLQDALNDALKEEIQHLRVLTGQTMPNGGPINFASVGRGQQLHPNSKVMHTHLAAQQFQQLQIRSRKQQHQLQQHQLFQRCQLQQQQQLFQRPKPQQRQSQPQQQQPPQQQQEQ